MENTIEIIIFQILVFTILLLIVFFSLKVHKKLHSQKLHMIQVIEENNQFLKAQYQQLQKLNQLLNEIQFIKAKINEQNKLISSKKD